MLFNKTVEQSKVQNVHLINGTVAIGKVKLNVYCFSVDGVLIDTGSHSLHKHFKSFLDGADVDKVMITHHHEDHTGGAGYLQESRGYPIFMHEKMAEYCDKRAAYPLYRQLFWGRRPPFKANSIGRTFDSRHAKWDVIETPGHAEDHVAFLNRETGQLFSGDLYVQKKTKLVLREEDIPTIISSLKRVLSYDFKEMFCCHAGYIENGRKALENKLGYLLELTDQVNCLSKDGWDEKEIHEKLFKKKYPIVRLSSGEWDSQHIISSILKNKGQGY